MELFSDEYQTQDDLVERFDHPSFPKGVAMWFSTIKTDLDAQRMDLMIKENGGDTADLLDRIRALIVACCRRWTVKLPASFVRPVLTEDGEVAHNDDGNVITEPHPLAGKVPPISWEYVVRLPDFVLRDIMIEVGPRYAGPLADRRSVQGVPSASTGTPPPAKPPRARRGSERSKRVDGAADRAG